MDLEKEKPDTDPFVIALAIDQKKQERLIPEEWIVVADGSQRKKTQNS